MLNFVLCFHLQPDYLKKSVQLRVTSCDYRVTLRVLTPRPATAAVTQQTPRDCECSVHVTRLQRCQLSFLIRSLSCLVKFERSCAALEGHRIKTDTRASFTLLAPIQIMFKSVAGRGVKLSDSGDHQWCPMAGR